MLPSSGLFTTDGAKLFYLNSYCSIAAPFLYNIKQFHHFNVNCCFNGGDCRTVTNILNYCCCKPCPISCRNEKRSRLFFYSNFWKCHLGHHEKKKLEFGQFSNFVSDFCCYVGKIIRDLVKTLAHLFEFLSLNELIESILDPISDW